MKKGFLSIGVSLFFSAMMLALAASLAAKPEGYSHVRVVRLSFVDGTVLVKRPGSADWAKASVNTPIQQGFSVSTSTGSFAEVQFENGSTARLGQLSQLDFTELALNPKGSKINQMALKQGYATFHLNPQHGDVYTVKAAETTLAPHGKTEFRTDLTPGQLRVEVFDGSVQATSPTQSAKITKGKVLETNTAPQEAFNVSHGIQKDSWDNWVHERDQQAELALNEGAVGIRQNVYGWSDLDAYGEWAFFPGFGYGWSPFVPAGWAPFSAGQWSWYPGFGYTWISAEPWGWLPFHYGFWNYAPGFGYFWMPPTSFGAWNPGIVSWYSGPGYVGWAARNASGAPACAAAGCITAVKTTAFENGVPVNSTSRVVVNNSQLTRVATPPVAAMNAARLSGVPVGRGVVYPGMPGGMTPQQYQAVTHAPVAASRAVLSAPVAPVAHTRAPSRPSAFAAAGHALSAPAPKMVLMGETAAQQARMRNASAHESFMGRAFGSHDAQPIRPQLGNTLGGHYAVSPNASRMPSALENPAMRRGSVQGVQPRFGASSMGRNNPVFLNRRSEPGFSGAAPRMGNHGIQMQRGRMSAPSSPPSMSPAGSHSAPMSAPRAAPATAAGAHR